MAAAAGSRHRPDNSLPPPCQGGREVLCLAPIATTIGDDFEPTCAGVCDDTTTPVLITRGNACYDDDPPHHSIARLRCGRRGGAYGAALAG